MSALDFPSSPTNNQEFSGYRYSSAKGAWLKIKDPITLTYVGDSAPSSPFNGQIWFNSALGITSVYYDDGDTSQWIEVVEAGAQGPTGPAGSLIMDISGSSPSGPTAGQVWYDSDDGKLYFYYADEDSGQWVEIASTVGSTGPTGPTGSFATPYSINQQTVSYSLVLSDAGKIIEMSSGSALNLTVPLDSSQNFTIGTSITVLQTNTGQVTLQATGGVTLNGTPGLKLRTQWSSATLIKRSANTWVAIGDLVP